MSLYDHQSIWKMSIRKISIYLKLAAVLIVLAVLTGIVIAVSRSCEGNGIHLSKEGHTEITPVEIDSIKSIGQWEFLSIADEEIVDTVRHGFFGDDQLSRIYYGTLRLGIDLSEAKDGWISMDKDTVVVQLPPVKLLDDNFIDEARTRSFIEDGKWSEADRARLTQKAIAAMRRRCLTAENKKRAGENAQRQMKQLIRSMGFKYVRIDAIGATP